MGKNAFIAFYNKLLNILRTTGLGQILFAETAKSPKFPDLILPVTHLKFLVKLPLCLGTPTKRLTEKYLPK